MKKDIRNVNESIKKRKRSEKNNLIDLPPRKKQIIRIKQKEKDNSEARAPKPSKKENKKTKAKTLHDYFKKN